MIAVFLASDQHTLTTRHVEHVHIVEHEGDDGVTLYDSLFFFLHGGILTLANSQWAENHVGILLGVLADHESPEALREKANTVIFDSFGATSYNV